MEDEKHGFQKPLASKNKPWWKRVWEWTAFGKKTGWDWLDLLVVSLALAVIGIWFSIAQAERDRHIQEQRAQADRVLEEQRADNTLLQAYLDQMSQLMLEKNMHTAEAGSAVSLLGRARTVTVLSQLEATPGEEESGKEQVVEFLIETGLVHRKNGKDPIISLEETYLTGIDLDKEDLHSANLRNAVMHDANLAGANLQDANLEHAKLMGANLKGANLQDANLNNTHLDNANLEGATMPDGQKYEEWLKDKEADKGSDAAN